MVATLAQQCTANTQAGRRCTRRAILGTNVCVVHGGRSPQVLAAARRRVAEHQAYQALHRFGVPVTVSPLDALLDELHRSAGVVAWFEEQLAATPEHLSGMVAAVDDFTPTGRRRGDSGGAVDAVGNGPALAVREEHTTVDEDGRETTRYRLVENPLLNAFRREREHLTKVAATCVKLGLERRVVDAQVASIKLQLRPVVDMLREATADPELADVAERVRAVIGRHIARRRELVVGVDGDI